MRSLDVDANRSPPGRSRLGTTPVVVAADHQIKYHVFSVYPFILLSITYIVVLFPPRTGVAQNLVRVKSKTSLELSLQERSRSTKLTGTLRDSLGIPLPKERVGIFAATDRKPQTAVTTDSKGEFTSPFTSKQTDRGIRVKFDGNAFYEATEAQFDASAHESPARLRSTPVSPREEATTFLESNQEDQQKENSNPLSIFWLLIPMGLSLAFVVATKRRQTRPNSESENEIESVHSPGIRKSLPIRYRRRDQTTISGTIRDLYSSEAVPHVELVLTHEHHSTISLEVTAEGFFSSPRLASGKWQIRARADGYVETTNEFLIPHRGEWTRIRIQMMSMRSLALQSYRKVAIKLLPMPQLWDVWTARETLQNTGRFLGSLSVFRSLVELVERSSYRRNPPSPKEVKTIETRASSVLEEISHRETDYTVTHHR